MYRVGNVSLLNPGMIKQKLQKIYKLIYSTVVMLLLYNNSRISEGGVIHLCVVPVKFTQPMPISSNY